MKDLVGIKELSRQDIEEILNTAKAFKEVLQRDIKKKFLPLEVKQQ